MRKILLFITTLVPLFNLGQSLDSIAQKQIAENTKTINFLLETNSQLRQQLLECQRGVKQKEGQSNEIIDEFFSPKENAFYSVQVFSAKEKHNADKFRYSLPAQHSAFTYSKKVNGEIRYVVLIGRESNYEDAEKLKAMIPSSLSINSFVIKLN